jgi:hypothetical protein
MLLRKTDPDSRFGVLLFAFATAMAVLLMIIGPAFAQEIVPTGTVLVQQATAAPWWLSYAEPIVAAIVTAAVGLIGTAAAFAINWLRTNTSIALDQQNGAALRATVESAARKMLMDLIANSTDGKIKLAGDSLVAAAEYVNHAVPDAVEHFQKTQSQVVDMVKGALPKAMAETGVHANLEDAATIAGGTTLVAGVVADLVPMAPPAAPVAPPEPLA